MPFVDSDFFLAIMKDEDWLKEKATDIYKKYENKLWTNGFVIAEILLISKRFELDHEKVVVSIYKIAQVKDLDQRTALLAAHFIKERGVGVFDALHAAYAKDDTILSSDSVFDKLGLERVKIEAD